MPTDVRELRIANHLDALRPLSAWIAKSLHALRIGAPWSDRLDLCAREAVTNIIEHGCADGRAHEIVLRLWREDACVQLEIEDDGMAFDPLTCPLPALDTTSDELPATGVGIALIRRSMTHCRHERRHERNVLSLIGCP